MNFEVEMEMKHFSHVHPLKPLEKTSDDYDDISFACCRHRSYSSVDDNQVVYGCEECNYFIHQACLEIPREIQHFYHPGHLLKLCIQRSEIEDCVACCKMVIRKFTYRCAECPDFIMDIDCALLPNKLENSNNSVHYRYHGHPLTLHEMTDDGTDYCSVCGTPCLGSVYRCAQCRISYHNSCVGIEIPQEIQHYYHPHPLRLTNPHKWARSTCLACQEFLNSFFAFECLDCASYMHIDCALLPEKIKQDGYVSHFSHRHPLSLCESGEEICKACKEPGEDPTYGCERCKFFIHGSCTELPLQINHPLHLAHSLTLTLIPKKPSRNYPAILCDGCLTDADNFLAYKCGECSFLLDVNCGGRNPTITSEGHDHIITLATQQPYHPTKENPQQPFHYGKCYVCYSAIPNGSVYFKCVSSSCQVGYINLHLLCGPLPCTIKDKCHVDSLKLMDAFVEDYNETDEVYCDTCEQLRDPNEPVYYCKECNFITEIKCVMSEVLRCLEGHNGDMKLRTANKTKIWHSGRVFSARCGNIIKEDDIEIETETEIKYIWEKYFEVKLDVPYKGIKFFTIGESVQILKILQEAGLICPPSEAISEAMVYTDVWFEIITSIQKQGRRSPSSYAIGEAEAESDIISVVPSYSDEALRNLMTNLDSFYGDPDFLYMLDYEVDIVRIGELMIMQDLASFLKGLLHAHGDFTTNSTLEPRLKMFFLNLLCDVVRSMCRTCVRELDEITLRRWWKSLQAVKRVGFEVRFVIDRLSRIALALFGMQVRASFAETKSQIDETYDEVKEMEAKLDAKKRELEALKSHLVLQKNAMEYERSPKMKECLECESELKWKKAWEGSPVMFRSFWDGSRDYKKRWT